MRQGQHILYTAWGITISIITNWTIWRSSTMKQSAAWRNSIKKCKTARKNGRKLYGEPTPDTTKERFKDASNSRSSSARGSRRKLLRSSARSDLAIRRCFRRQHGV